VERSTGAGQPAWQPVRDRHDARDPLKSYLRAMTNPYGVVLDDASLRWAAAESARDGDSGYPPPTPRNEERGRGRGQAQRRIHLLLLETRSVDEVVAKPSVPETVIAAIHLLLLETRSVDEVVAKPSVGWLFFDR
jgi:hypothetical protein